jgi:signal peptidase II
MWALAVSIVVLDQITKSLVILSFALNESRPVIPGLFHFTYIRNTGAAWGMFGGFNTWLAFFSAVVLGFLILFRRSLLGDNALARWAFALLAGGILGNCLDRVRWFYVVDFLDFFWKESHFPAFNVADSAIFCGVCLLLFSSWSQSSRWRVDPGAMPVDPPPTGG